MRWGFLHSKQTSRIPDLLAYASLIINEARWFKGNGWQVYDTNFRSQAAASKISIWAQTNSLLWTTIFSSAEAFDHCSYCVSVNHTTEECTQNQKIKKPMEPDPGLPSSAVKKEATLQPICKNWNYSRCLSPTCSYHHRYVPLGNHCYVC